MFLLLYNEWFKRFNQRRTHQRSNYSREAEKVIIEQKLNPNNPVHLLGLAGTFISDIFLRDFKAMVKKLEKYEINDGEQITNDKD